MNLYKSQREFFKKAYQKEETPWPRIEPTHETKIFLQLIKKEISSGKMLDLGCGEGRHSLLFHRQNFKTYGIDYQPSALLKALRRFKALNRSNPERGLYFLAADVFFLPFLPQSFDVVVDYGCLHHIKKNDFKIYLSNLLSMLKQNGFYILSCFSTEFKHHPEEKRMRNWLVHKGHYDRFFSKSEFPRLFGDHFNIIQILEEKHGIEAFFHLLMRRK